IKADTLVSGYVDMLSAGFERAKWPRRHEHLVEECVAAQMALHVNDLLPGLPEGWGRELLRTWTPPTRPSLTLVPRMGGPFRRCWFRGPRCDRRCETS